MCGRLHRSRLFRPSNHQLSIQSAGQLLSYNHASPCKQKSGGNHVLTMSEPKRNGESGQAILIVAVSMSIFLLGATGLAIDVSHLYAQRQMAQAAADAGAMAGIVSVFDNYNAAANTAGAGTSAFATNAGFTCATSSAKTPCYYAQTLNGFNTGSDTVAIDYPTAATVGVPPGSLSGSDPVNLLRVTVSRQVPTTLMQFLSPATPTIKASATGAIVQVDSPIPIVVTHHTLAGAFSSNGNPTVTICGGPSQSIQVNSTSATAAGLGSNTTIDLSKAGPLDPGDCSAGTGANMGVWGGPATPGWTDLLGVGQYIQPNDPLEDPLRGVTAPVVATTVTPTHTALANGVNGCPASPAKACFLYSPGYYTSDIDVQNETAVFRAWNLLYAECKFQEPCKRRDADGHRADRSQNRHWLDGEHACLYDRPDRRRRRHDGSDNGRRQLRRESGWFTGGVGISGHTFLRES